MLYNFKILLPAIVGLAAEALLVLGISSTWAQQDDADTAFLGCAELASGLYAKDLPLGISGVYPSMMCHSTKQSLALLP